MEVGPVEQITERPQHPYTRSLLEATPEVSWFKTGPEENARLTIRLDVRD